MHVFVPQSRATLGEFAQDLSDRVEIDGRCVSQTFEIIDDLVTRALQEAAVWIPGFGYDGP